MVFCWCVDVKCCLEEWKDLYKRCAEDWNVKTKFRGKFQIGRRNFTENSRNKQSRIQLITQCHDKVLRINQQKEKKSTFAWSTQNGWQNVMDKSVYDAKISRQNSMENTEYWDKNNILKFEKVFFISVSMQFVNRIYSNILINICCVLVCKGLEKALNSVKCLMCFFYFT